MEFHKKRYFIEIPLGINLPDSLIKLSGWFSNWLTESKNDKLPKRLSISFHSPVFIHINIQLIYLTLHPSKSIVLIELSRTVQLVLNIDLSHSYRKISNFLCSFYVLYYFPPEGVGRELKALNLELTKLILQIGCPSYHLSLWRKSALLQKP